MSSKFALQMTIHANPFLCDPPACSPQPDPSNRPATRTCKSSVHPQTRHAQTCPPNLAINISVRIREVCVWWSGSISMRSCHIWSTTHMSDIRAWESPRPPVFHDRMSPTSRNRVRCPSACIESCALCLALPMVSLLLYTGECLVSCYYCRH